MRVSMDASDVGMSLGNNGIVLYVKDNRGRHLGKLRIGQATVEWCKGRTRIGNGRKMTLHRFVTDILDEM
jgi:hypothetical protein